MLAKLGWVFYNSTLVVCIRFFVVIAAVVLRSEVVGGIYV